MPNIETRMDRPALEEIVKNLSARTIEVSLANKLGYERVAMACSASFAQILGLPPDWYKSPAYRARVAREPRPVLRELGLELPESVKIRVWDTTAETRYFVLPMQPAGTEGWSEDQLRKIVTRDSMIGISRLEPQT